MVVGNGAAELIKSLMGCVEGGVGVIYPTFEEYPNRLSADRIVAYYPSNGDFSYTADDIVDFYSEKEIGSLLIVNPDNPSGNMIGREGLERLAVWAEERGVRLIVDESFVDFADEAAETTLLHNGVLEAHPTMCVMKSISKSYGVPGLRLGVLASADRSLIDFMRKDVGIWNINSFAEFYMQIYGKYEKDYVRSCEKFREERAIFERELREIPFLRVIPSQANYFLCEVLPPFTSYNLTLQLLERYSILIKDCTSKKGFPNNRHFIRIAIRNRKDDIQMFNALKGLIL